MKYWQPKSDNAGVCDVHLRVLIHSGPPEQVRLLPDVFAQRPLFRE